MGHLGRCAALQHVQYRRFLLQYFGRVGRHKSQSGKQASFPHACCTNMAQSHYSHLPISGDSVLPPCTCQPPLNPACAFPHLPKQFTRAAGTAERGRVRGDESRSGCAYSVSKNPRVRKVAQSMRGRLLASPLTTVRIATSARSKGPSVALPLPWVRARSCQAVLVSPQCAAFPNPVGQVDGIRSYGLQVGPSLTVCPSQPRPLCSISCILVHRLCASL